MAATLPTWDRFLVSNVITTIRHLCELMHVIHLIPLMLT